MLVVIRAYGKLLWEKRELTISFEKEFRRVRAATRAMRPRPHPLFEKSGVKTFKRDCATNYDLNDKYPPIFVGADIIRQFYER